MPTFSRNGNEIFYELAGAGTPLLFIHGFPLDGRMWRDQLAEFSASHRVIVPDLPGFGKSPPREGAISMAEFADDLVALLDDLKVTTPIVLCGLSMGGYIAFQFALRHSNRLRGLVLCDTRSVADTPKAAADRKRMASIVLEKGPEPIAEAMLPKMCGPNVETRAPDVMPRLREMMLQATPQGIASALLGMASRPDVGGDLPRIKVPSLVVVGSDDAISTPDEMQTIAERIRSADFIEVAGAGHMSPMEQPGAFNSALRKFLARL